MITTFPKTVANKAIITYFLAFLISTILFHRYAMDVKFMLFGIGEVLMFFLGASSLTVKWSKLPVRTFENNVFWWAFSIRFVWVVFSYFFFLAQTGKPFEFGAADVFTYQDEAEWLSRCDWKKVIDYLFLSREGISDSGYIFYLSTFYRVFGVNILLARFAKCLFSSYLCVLMFRIASRNFGLATGRMTAIFCMLMPNLIWYCGLHLKEAEMIFLSTLCVERADYALRQDGTKSKFWAFFVAGLAALILFTFRTALAAVLLLAIGCAIIFSSKRVLSRWKKWVFGSLLAIGMVATMGQQIVSEVSDLWEGRNTNQKTSMAWRATRENGNKFANKASVAVFAPLIFTIPFPTVVDIQGQENQQMLNGGNFVKNITSFFTIFALIMMLLSGDWRNHVLPIAFMCGYLAVIALSAFAQSERFHLPALPFELMFAAYGVTQINKLEIRLFKYWPYLIFVAIIGWSWFKLAGRGLI